MTTSIFILAIALIVSVLAISISIDSFTKKICRKIDEALAVWERIEKQKREQLKKP